MTDEKTALDLDDLAARPRDVDAAAADQITGGAKSKAPAGTPGPGPTGQPAPTGPQKPLGRPNPFGR